MRYIKKNNHMSWPDPDPVGICEVCGLPIEQGESYREVQEGFVHDDGEYCKVHIGGREESITCLMTYIIQGYDARELADILGLERRG